jgi:hypothetical protein
MKPLKSTILITFFLLFIISCQEPNNNNTTGKNLQNDTFKSRENVLALLLRKTNLDHPIGRLKNLEDINGFRSLKLGTLFDNLYFSGGWNIHNYNFMDSSVTYAEGEIFLEIENHIFGKAILTFFNKKLIAIDLRSCTYDIDFYNLLCDLYGKPNIKNTFIPLIYKKPKESDESSNENSFIDVSGIQPKGGFGTKTGAEKYVNRVVQKPNVNLIWRINNIELKCFEYNDFGIHKYIVDDNSHIVYGNKQRWIVDDGISFLKLSLVNESNQAADALRKSHILLDKWAENNKKENQKEKLKNF